MSSSITWKMEKRIDNGEIFGYLLTDLSKAFDCLDHELSIAKLNGYGFSLPALKSIRDYPNRKQITRINFSFSEWLEFDLRVPQGRIWGLLLFNNFLTDLFLIMEDIDITSYVHSNTPYVSKYLVDEVIDPSEQTANTLQRWF